jgi:hypothetical protein
VAKNYRPLSNRESDVLYAMWHLEYQQKVKATRQRMADLLGISKGDLANCLSDVKSISDDYYRPISNFEERMSPRGRPPAFYQLNDKRFVTWPETAALFLDLLIHPPKKPGRIDRNEFIKSMVKKYGFDSDFVERKINWGIDNLYISADEPSFLYPDNRITFEQSYLKKVAGNL